LSAFSGNLLGLATWVAHARAPSERGNLRHSWSGGGASLSCGVGRGRRGIRFGFLVPRNPPGCPLSAFFGKTRAAKTKASYCRHMLSSRSPRRRPNAEPKRSRISRVSKPALRPTAALCALWPPAGEPWAAPKGAPLGPAARVRVGCPPRPPQRGQRSGGLGAPGRVLRSRFALRWVLRGQRKAKAKPSQDVAGSLALRGSARPLSCPSTPAQKRRPAVADRPRLPNPLARPDTPLGSQTDGSRRRRSDLALHLLSGQPAAAARAQAGSQKMQRSNHRASARPSRSTSQAQDRASAAGV